MSASARPLPNHRPRRWLPYTGAVLLIALIVAGLWPRPVPVETARVSRGTLQYSVNEEGKTRIKQRYVVSAPVAGQLRRIAFKAGTEVQCGQTLLAIIDPVAPTLLDARTRTATAARKEMAEANLEKARASLTFATSELHRFEKLFAEKTVSAQELESAQWREAAAAKEQAAAESSVRQAEAELAEFNSIAVTNGLSPREVLSPASGRVLKVFEENARTVAAGTPLLEIGNPTDLEVVIEVLSRDGAVIAPGARVELDQWGGSEPLQGKVRLVEPAAFTKVSALGVEEQRVNVVADLLTPAAERPQVGDNFRVEARIIVWESNNVLKVPAGALFRRGDEWATFVLDAGRAQIRVVKVGRSSGKETQIIEGVKEGDIVVLYPGSRIHEGQRAKQIEI